MISRISLAALVLTGCLEHQDGATVRLRAKTSPLRTDDTSAALDPNVPLVFTTSDGHTATLTAATLALARVGLEPCGESTAMRLFKLIAPWGTAWAHEEGDATALEGPWTLEAGAAPLDLGTFSPPAARYCEVHVEIGAYAITGNEEGWPVELRGTIGDHVALPLSPPLDLEDGGEATLTVEAGYGGWLDDVPLSGVDPRPMVSANILSGMHLRR